jgi:hypothetical protein
LRNKTARASAAQNNAAPNDNAELTLTIISLVVCRAGSLFRTDLTS